MKLAFVLMNLIAASAFAGNSSTVGPGTPELRLDCVSADESLRVSILRSWPNYHQDKLFVGRSTQTLVIENVARISSSQVGGVLRYEGQRFALKVLMTSPIFQNGDVLMSATLSDSQGQLQGDLLCRSFLKN